MLEETRLLQILDMLSERAREFTHVSDDILETERALQSQDGDLPDKWQVICTISSFINYIAERNRCRYGHFAFDIDPKNNNVKEKDAQCTLSRMQLFWNRDEDDEIGELSDYHKEQRAEHVAKFLENDAKIKEHVKDQPDFYAMGVQQSEHRSWMMRLRVLGGVETRLISEWTELVNKQREEVQKEKF